MDLNWEIMPRAPKHTGSIYSINVIYRNAGVACICWIHLLKPYVSHILHAYRESIYGIHIWNRIEYMSWIYGFSYGFRIWIQNMASLFPCHVCIPYMVSLHAISIWIRDIHLAHGLNIWIQYVGSLCAFNIWIQCMHSIYAFPACI